MSTIVVPIDASQVSDKDRKQQRVKVAIRTAKGVKSQVVSVESGHTEVKLEVDPKYALDIAVGPENASDVDIFNLQTIAAKVSPSQWGEGKSLTISPILVTPAWWIFWLYWCRDFTITGRVVCADGSAVPGAEVRAYDVDFFWWWSSISQVGPLAVTDGAGQFTIKFRWCCGWWPWWWWQLRRWTLNLDLVNKIRPILQLNPAVRFPEPGPTPSFDVVALATTQTPSIRSPRLSSTLAVTKQLDPSTIPTVRDRLLAVLPQVPELERLRIWPWWSWTPWFDCTPDIIFRVTQNCGGADHKVIVNETVFQTRWDIPTNLNVTLVASDDACCLPNDGGQPEGDCALITGVCGDPGIPLTNIGRTGATAGYADPGGRDRPFSEVVTLSGQFGTAAQADFYEIEYTSHGAGAWAPLPAAALQDMTRGYFDATKPWPNQWFYVGFPVEIFGTKHVYRSRQFYEASNPPLNWGNPLSGRTWFYNVNQIASIQTLGNFADGTYDFRLVGYKATSGGVLDPSTRKVMDGCGDSAENNLIVLRIDNRVVAAPTPGSVHVNTSEPDCGITAVRLGGAVVEPCGAKQLQAGTPLEVDFFVTDPDGHLDHYELKVLYDLGSVKNLLSSADVGSFSLLPPGSQSGPDYADALAEGAVRPTWKGGSFTLHVDNASNVFPKTCCYLIELTVWKRNIVSCDGHLTYYNQMHYSFTVTV